MHQMICYGELGFRNLYHHFYSISIYKHLFLSFDHILYAGVSLI